MKLEKLIKSAKKIDYPNGKWHWTETNVDILCDDLNNYLLN